MQMRSAPAPTKDLRAELGSLALFALAIFSLFAILTYSPQDPGFFSSSHAAVQNACGRVGAYLASLGLQCFGLGSFLLPAAIGFVSACVYKREGWTRVMGTLGGMTIAVIALTVFLSLQWKYWPYSGSLLLTGGAFGAWVSEILLRQFNSVGSSIVSLLVFCLALAWSTPVSVARIGAATLKFLWRMTRVALTTVAFLAGVALTRFAQIAGRALVRFLEAAGEQARDGWSHWQESRQRHQQEKSEIEIGPENVTDKKRKVLAVAAESPDLQLTLPEPIVHSEAPNALPELEKKLHPLVAAPEAVAATSSAAEILPHDSLSTGTANAGIAATQTHPGSTTPAPAPKRQRFSRPRRSGQWKLPSIEFLKKPPKVVTNIDEARLKRNAETLERKFLDFGIEGEITAVRPGPVITLYEFKPGPGVKLSRIASMADDLSMALSAQSVRIIAPIPGKAVVGIEIPSDQREAVYLREFLDHKDFFGDRHSIPVVMGKDIGGQPVLSDLAKMPHLLVAGTTGSGKSVFTNALVCSLLYRFTPDELRMIIVDPKFVEFAAYQDIPHLLLPVVDDPKNAATALKWAVREMERRYRLIGLLGTKNLAGFNQKVDEMGAEVVRDLLVEEQNRVHEEENGQQVAPVVGGDWMEAFETDEDGQPRVGKLPYIVIIIDELADLMAMAKKDVEHSIQRIAQKARAAGIHLLIATQRPSTDVVTGTIKANLPSRASFQLRSNIDSRTILDKAGAEKLLGQGDMLFIPPGVASLLRLHGAYVSEEEIEKVASFLKSQGKPSYRNEILFDEEAQTEGESEDGEDELFPQALEIARETRSVSASFLQRRLGVGYNRAARLVEEMEARGIIGPQQGSKPREVLI